MHKENLADYYKKRAREYERVYGKPKRQADLRRLKNVVTGLFRGLDVLEIACGTGYWTRIASRSARSIVATDLNDSVMEIARGKDYGNCRVKFVRTDAYTLEGIDPGFTAALMGFWWSHVPRSRLREFVRVLHSKLSPGALVVLMDNRYVEGSSTPLSRTDEEGNTYQVRKLDDGSRHEVLKNFPDRDEILRLIEPWGKNREYTELDYYWMASCRLKDCDTEAFDNRKDSR